MNNSFKIANSINMIDDDLILEADEVVKSKASSKKPVYLRYAAAAAACLCVAGGAAAIAKTRTAPKAIFLPEVVDRENSGIQITDNDLNSAAPVSEIPDIKTSEVNFNEAPDTVGASVAGDIDLRQFDTVLWYSTDIIEYFGWDLTPAYIPEGLIPKKSNGSTCVYYEKGNDIIIDRTVLSFYHDYDENGYPKYTENVAATKGFELIASKIGHLDLCCVLYLRDGMTASSINGTEVFFAHLPMSYGPYDPETREPSGYYDMYVAEFELDGISYRVTTKQLEADEIVKIVSSIICGDSFSVEE